MKNDVDLLFEIGTLRFVDRTWKQFLGADVANVAEHTFRVLWIALLIARKERVAIDEAKLLKMALVHDVTESRTGDVHYLSRQYTERNEALAAQDIFDATLLKDFEQIWHAYEKRDSLEAKIVKDADTIDIELELREQQVKGEGLKTLFGKRRKENVEPRLYTKTAKKLWPLIEKANPHAWHNNSPRNRHNAGDWKKGATSK